MILLDFIKIDLSLALLLFIPGYSILIALTRNKNPLELLGTIIVSTVMSLTIVNFVLMLIDKIGFDLSPVNIVLSISTISALSLFFYGALQNKKPIKKPIKKQNWLPFLIITLFAIFLRLIYLIPKVIPHTTDLGHHMYWVNYIIKFQELPIYGTPDVIIGEHIIFGALSILTGIGIFTALPLMLLFIINIFSLLAIFLLTEELASLIFKKKQSFFIALVSLLSIGVLYSIASPQASYINGGVIGNLMGGMFIPTIFYLFIKAFKNRDPILASIGIFLIGNLIYTHHLSAFIFIYSLLGFLVIFLISFLLIKFYFKKNNLNLNPFLKTFFNLNTFLTGILILIWIFIIRIPSYLNVTAIDSAVGDPSKATRFGLTINNIINSTGPWRFFYSLIGIAFLTFLFWKIIQKKTRIEKIYQIEKIKLINFIIFFSLLIGWFGTIFIMSYKPNLLKVDIISSRIVNYLTYSSAILAALGVYAILCPIFSKNFSPLIKNTLFSLIFIPAIISGLFDVSENYPETNTAFDKTIQTFKGSQYLAEKTTEKQKILRDHVYLTGDTWIKNFLMRGYEEPISRTFSKKYIDPIRDRETCTRDMIDIPESSIGKDCFKKTGVKFIILRDNYDTLQFEKSDNFSKIFSTNEAVIFQRNYE